MNLPALSVAIITPDDFSTIRRTVSRVAAQDMAGQIELLVVAGDCAAVSLDYPDVSVFHSRRVVSANLSSGTGEARALAVRAASAPVIVFCEDHCFPDDGWAAALLEAHAGPYVAVGPVLRNANPATVVSWADFLMGYGPWLAPGRSGERDHLPGHNSSYKRDPLVELGSELVNLIEAETPLQWRLRAAGHRLFQESRAVASHTNFDRWGTWLHVTWHAGRVFASTRARPWSPARRFAFAMGTPVIPFVRLWRHLRQGHEAGLGARLLARIAPALLVGLAVSAAGEFAGTIAGSGESRAILVGWDFHRNVPRVPAA